VGIGNARGKKSRADKKNNFIFEAGKTAVKIVSLKLPEKDRQSSDDSQPDHREQQGSHGYDQYGMYSRQEGYESNSGNQNKPEDTQFDHFPIINGAGRNLDDTGSGCPFLFLRT
jgi:hypothetical protein